MSFATRKRRITCREANRMQTSRASVDRPHPRGELDLVTVETLRAALDGIESTERLVLDLRSLSFIDSSGLHLLVALHQRAQRDGLRLTLVAPAAPVDRAIRLCGLDTELPFVAAVDAQPGEPASSPRGDR